MIKSKSRASFVCLTLLAAGLLLAYTNIDKTNFSYWYQDFDRKNEPYTLLLGSSSILRMPSDLITDCQNPVVYGFNNGTTESIETYLVLANLANASKVVLYIGENDIARGEKPVATFSQLQAIINAIISKTNGTIGIVKLKYSPARANSHADVLSFNRMLEKQYANTEVVQLIPFDEIIHADLFTADGIHLNIAGNKKFSEWINDFCRT